MTRAGLSLLLLVLVVSITAPTRLAAHPAAATEVILTTLRSGHFELAIVTDLAPFAAKLEALANTSGVTRDASPADRIVALQHVLRTRLDLRFDGRAVDLGDVAVTPSSTRAGKGVIRYAGLVPAGAEHVAWHSTVVFGSYPFVVRRGHSDVEPDSLTVTDEVYEWLHGSQQSAAYGLNESSAERPSAFWSSVTMGVSHIVPHGLDHVLFVVGLCLLATGWRAVLLQVSAFTIAHSITLALAVNDIVSVPAGIVEPLIALSIAYIAIENLFTSTVRGSRLGLIFVFGLLHGLGFAGALMESSLPAADVVATLVGFNIGVELGQLTVVLTMAVVVGCLGLREASYRRFVVQPTSLAIALTGLFWVAERTL